MIVTTNYDDLMERALDAAGETYDVMSYIRDGEDRGKFRHSRSNEASSTVVHSANDYEDVDVDLRPVVLKFHGAVDRIETPYLQLVMTHLWDEESRAGSQMLRFGTLHDLGGAGRIVRTHLDRAMDSLEPGEVNVVADSFDRLVTPSGTKIAYTLANLAELARVSIGQLSSILEKL